MTTLEITTQPKPSTTAIPQFVVPSVVAAQRAGDADYDAMLQLDHDGQQAATAYHVAYQRIARMPGGCGPVCDCDRCRGEFGKGGAR
jgi:hypothetical protein